MRNNIVAGNWKMNNDATQTTELINDLNKALEEVSINCRVLISPTSINLTSAVALTEDSVIEVAAQNMHQAKNGAFTGEISAAMLNDVGVKSVILGHSERRTYFGEDDQILTEKVASALENNLEIIFCFGELLQDRKSGNHFKVVESQLKNTVLSLNAAHGSILYWHTSQFGPLEPGKLQAQNKLKKCMLILEVYWCLLMVYLLLKMFLSYTEEV